MFEIRNAASQATIAECEDYEEIQMLLRAEQKKVRALPGVYERVDVIIGGVAIPYRMTASRIERIV